MPFSFSSPLLSMTYDGGRIVFGFLVAVFLFFLTNFVRTQKSIHRLQAFLAGAIGIFGLWVLVEPLLTNSGIPPFFGFSIQLLLVFISFIVWFLLRKAHLRMLQRTMRLKSVYVEFGSYLVIVGASVYQLVVVALYPSINEISIACTIILSQIGLVTLSLCFVVLEEKKHHTIEQNATQARRELNYIHTHDTLTGLLNRNSFFGRLKAEADSARKGSDPLAFFYLDLDHFRSINDNLTNEVGNLLLRSVAERLIIAMSDAQCVFRTGEDEFAIMAECPHSHVDAAMIAEDLLGVFNKPFTIFDSEVFLSASIGIAFLDTRESPEKGAEKLNQQLDQALAQAKLDHNTYRFYTPNLGERGLSNLQYVNYLRQAIDRHELSLHFQPQIDRNGKVVSAEALIRWNNPELGSVPPSAFIPIAEEAGLIIPIGDWVIEHACAELAHWHSLGLNIPMAINISTRQLKDIRLEKSLLSSLKKYGLHPSYLHLEITESSLLEENDRTIQTLLNLSKSGFKLSIDDFGTGYANLNWLKRLPVSTVKIDRSFVVELPENTQDMALVQAMVDMAKGMGLSIIAEGVESLRQLEVLRAAECSIIQGFFYSRPLPSVEFLAFAFAQSA